MSLSCGSDPDAGSATEGAESEPEPVAASPDDEIDARGIYNLKCAPCHGTDFRGSGEGADLTERLPTISDERAFDSIANGRPPGMPAWGDSTTDDEIRALVEFLRREIE